MWMDGERYKCWHPPDELLPAARELAVEIARNTSAVSTALSRQMLWRMMGAAHPMEAYRIESRALHYMFGSADLREGVASFLEKRPPDFKLKPSRDMPGFFPWWNDPSYDDE